ncbi:MAG TPA: zinc-binding alcohol dehydrogenase family protein [Deltaproteobacteria bacterium]|nr:zinc-binding alcohol dehydrogenase family protein [Deltaproteobacteria bacterium]
MKRMVLNEPGSGTLELEDGPVPEPGPGEIRVRVRACGVCRTDLHVVDAELPDPRIPIVPGHEVVGVVDALGEGVSRFQEGDRVGIPWLASACGTCPYCRSGRENLCPKAVFTGYQVDGGYAECAIARADYALPLPEQYGDTEAAPLLCAGLIGHRAYRMTGAAKRIGLYGFGAAAHIICQVAVFEEREVFAFTREGDDDAQALARSLGATWTGASTEAPPVPLDAAILFAPVGELVPIALSHVVPGGVVVCAGIHMSDIPSFPYRLLWEERVLRSVANLTRRDAEDFLAIAPRVPVKTQVTPYPLDRANEALNDLRTGHLVGAAVLIP